MNHPKLTASGERILGTMIELAQCSKLHRIIVAGSTSPHFMFDLNRHGYNRVATTATCGLPRGQYDVAFVTWRLNSIKALETTLEWLVHLLAPTSVLVIWIDSSERTDRRKLGSILEKLGFRVEAGTCCVDGFAISARRLDAKQRSFAA